MRPLTDSDFVELGLPNENARPSIEDALAMASSPRRWRGQSPAGAYAVLWRLLSEQSALSMAADELQQGSMPKAAEAVRKELVELQGRPLLGEFRRSVQLTVSADSEFSPFGEREPSEASYLVNTEPSGSASLRSRLDGLQRLQRLAEAREGWWTPSHGSLRLPGRGDSTRAAAAAETVRRLASAIASTSVALTAAQKAEAIERSSQMRNSRLALEQELEAARAAAAAAATDVRRRVAELGRPGQYVPPVG